MSHGEKILVAEHAVSEQALESATESGPSVLPRSTEEENIGSSEALPVIERDPVASPAVEGIEKQEIFAQSAVDTMLPWTLQDVFFDYDQIAIRPDAVSVLEQNALVLLKRYPKREVLIQGHCDERGTESYNLVLGERRATAVKDYLVNLGVSASQLRVLSLGKSQPFCLERTLACFRQNRRAHFVLK